MFLAAALASTPAAQRLGQIPMEFWLRLSLAVAVLVATILLLRKLAQVNKVVLAVGVGLGVSIIGFSWIYERNEPAWATPAVRWLAGFFPTKDTAERHRAGL